MSLHAIGAIVTCGSVVGARIYNTETCRLIDVGTEHILNRLNNGVQIKNLGIKDGKLDWASGNSGRYPQIEDLKVKDNANVLTVLSVLNGEDRKYNVVDGSGRLAAITEPQVIMVAKKFGLSNCKLVTKENREFIQSISGSIEEEKVAKLLIRLIGDEIKITLPQDGSIRAIKIPETINLFPVSEVTSISVKPKSAALRVKAISFPSNMNKLYNFGMLEDLPNLEVVVINSYNVDIEAETFSNKRYLREVYINGASNIRRCAFKNCTELRKFVIKTVCEEIGARVFENCINLDINNLLSYSINNISDSVFSGITAESIIVGYNCRFCYPKMFCGIKGLRDIKILNPKFKCILAKGMTMSFSGQDKKDLYIYPGCEVENAVLCDDVNIHYLTGAEKDENGNPLSDNVDITIFKAKLAGYSGDKFNVASSFKDIDVLLKIHNQALLTDCVNNAFSRIISSGTNKVLAQLGIFKLEIAAHNLAKDSIQSVNELDKCLVFRTGRDNVVLISDKKFLTQVFSRQMANFSVTYPILILPLFNVPIKKKVNSVEFTDTPDGSRMAILHFSGEDYKLIAKESKCLAPLYYDI